MLKTSYDQLYYKLIVFLFGIIYLQQVLVVNVGGSFKIYELTAFLLLTAFCVRGRKYLVHSQLSMLLFFFFIISPLPGTLYQYLTIDALDGFYQRFPEARGSLRYNLFVAPLIIYLYYVICWLVINTINGSSLVFANQKYLVRLYVTIGTIVSIYSLYGFFFVRIMGFPDLVPGMVDYRNHRPTYELRTSGFSSEAGDFAFMISWVVIYLFYYPNLFTRKKTLLLIAINGVTLILTFSTNLIAFTGAVGLTILAFDSIQKKMKLAIGISTITLISFYFIANSGYYELFKYVFFEKATNLLEKPEIVASTGSIRSYHIYMGFELFNDYKLFGVGGGNSVFHLWKYDDLMSAQLDGVKSGLVKVIAETGLFGSFFFYGFYIASFGALINRRKRKDSMIKIGFAGLVTTILMQISLYPVYSIFLWINLALVLNHLKFSTVRAKRLQSG